MKTCSTWVYSLVLPSVNCFYKDLFRKFFRTLTFPDDYRPDSYRQVTAPDAIGRVEEKKLGPLALPIAIGMVRAPDAIGRVAEKKVRTLSSAG